MRRRPACLSGCAPACSRTLQQGGHHHRRRMPRHLPSPAPPAPARAAAASPLACVVLCAPVPCTPSRLRNPCYSQWVNQQAYRIHVVVAGLVIMVLSVVGCHCCRCCLCCCCFCCCWRRGGRAWYCVVWGMSLQPALAMHPRKAVPPACLQLIGSPPCPPVPSAGLHPVWVGPSDCDHPAGSPAGVHPGGDTHHQGNRHIRPLHQHTHRLRWARPPAACLAAPPARPRTCLPACVAAAEMQTTAPPVLSAAWLA